MCVVYSVCFVLYFSMAGWEYNMTNKPQVYNNVIGLHFFNVPLSWYTYQYRNII